jgi:hypothetical protein
MLDLSIKFSFFLPLFGANDATLKLYIYTYINTTSYVTALKIHFINTAFEKSTFKGRTERDKCDNRYCIQ